MGIFDIPAVIETVTDITKQQSMYFVGISMGATLLAVMLAERPEYNPRIATAFLLGPSIYLGHTALYIQPFLNFVNYYQASEFQTKNVQKNSFNVMYPWKELF